MTAMNVSENIAKDNQDTRLSVIIGPAILGSAFVIFHIIVVILFLFIKKKESQKEDQEDLI